MLYLGTAGSIEEDLARRAGLNFRAIESGQLRGMRPWTAASGLAKAARGASQAASSIRSFRPQATFVTGGYVAAPVVWASWLARVPVLIYLPDVEPGLAIRRLSRFASRVAVTFSEVVPCFPGKAVVTGYPVRPEFTLAAQAGQPAARQALGLRLDQPVLLVFGGSRGARSINQALAAGLEALLAHCQVIHVSGSLDWPQVQQQALLLPPELQTRYHPFAYLYDEMPLAMAAADLVVARAGAATLGEFPLMGLPSILVPYPHSGQHQEVNADYLVRRGAAVKLADADLETQLVPTILELLEDPEALAALRRAASYLAQPDAADRIAGTLLELVR